MTRQDISKGTSANDGTGDTLRQAATKINENFVEIYQKFGGDSDILMPGISFDSNNIIFEGTSVDANQTTLTVTNPTSDNIITFPDSTGDVVITTADQQLYKKHLYDTKIDGALRLHGVSGTGYYLINYDGTVDSGTDRNIHIPALTDSATLVFDNHTQTLTNKTLTTPTINSPTIGTLINDANGAEIIKLTATSSATNEITIANAAASSGPTISTTGTDTNISLNLTSKGTGAVRPSKLAPTSTTQTADGAVSTSSSFIIFNKGTALAATLADGTITGELKYMININTGLVTVTPTSFAQGTSFSIAQNGAAQIIWGGSNWFMIGGADSANSYISIT